MTVKTEAQHIVVDQPLTFPYSSISQKGNDQQVKSLACFTHSPQQEMYV